ncbi:hypothetical protein E4T56_gene5647 [Termitomyces sp. T112]|nr:hypothetical protein E4T56_gene5647 [Termitomyces sp. T112]
MVVPCGSPWLSSLIGQWIGMHFADQADFPRITEQKGLFDSLATILPTLDCGAAHDSADVQALLTFANAITQIEKNHQEAQRKCEAKEKRHTKDQDIKMLGLSAACFGKCKANPKKIKVIPAYANLKPGSKAVLLLLGQINAALKAVQLADDGTLLPHANLQKHHNAVQLAAQQQLYSLDITLQTYKLISTHLNHLDKTLGPSHIKCTGDLLNNLQVLREVLSSFLTSFDLSLFYF